MSVSLRPLRDEDWEAFLATTKAGYTSDMIASGIAPELAHAKADKDFETLLPQRFATPGHFLVAVEDDGSVAGWLWLADRGGDNGRTMFVFAIELFPEFRGRGIGRAAMTLAEEETRKHGIPSLSLNVFGSNDVARRLYTSLGYHETAIHMEKRL